MTRISTEGERQAALDAFGIDAFEDTAYDDITRLAAHTFDVPIALISIVDRDRQWFVSKVGLLVDETPRDVSFCTHAVETPTEVFVVEDAAKDERFATNPLVVGDPGIRFYAGVPLTLTSGHAIGTVCVIDTKPRTATAEQLETLRFLAAQVVRTLESRRDKGDR